MAYNYMRSIKFFVIGSLVLPSWAYADIADCTALRLGEASSHLRVNFVKGNNCGEHSATCDRHQTLKIPRSEFSENLLNRLLKRFEQCEQLLRNKGDKASILYANTIVKQKNKLSQNPTNFNTFVEKVKQGNQLLSQYTHNAHKFEANSQKLLRIAKKSTDITNLASDASTLLQQRTATLELYQALQSFLETNDVYGMGRGFYPSQLQEVNQLLKNINTFPEQLFTPHLVKMESALQPVFNKYGSRFDLTKMDSVRLKAFKSDADSATTINENLYRQIEQHTHAFSQRQQERLDNILNRHNSIVQALEGIDVAISKLVSEEEQKRQSSHNRQIALKNNSLALVANKLGYADNRFLTRPANNARQANGNIAAWPFYGYLYCLSKQYHDYVFQMHEVKMQDSSRRLVLDLYSDASASDESHAAQIQFAKSNWGYYVFAAEDYESGLDQRSQYHGLVFNLFNRCMRQEP